MRDALEIVPYVSTALAFVDLFVGGGKKDNGSGPIELHPLTTQSISEYYGTITSNQLYIAQDFWLPGSDNVNRPVRKRPWYNNTLGIFNLVKTPSIRYDYEERCHREDREEICIGNHWIEFNDELDYVINYAAGFDNSNFPDVEGELVLEFNGLLDDFELTDYDGLIAQKVGNRLITRRLPVSCLNDVLNLHFDLENIDHTIPVPTLPNINTIKIKLYANLKRSDADASTQNVLFVGAYPLNIVFDDNLENTFTPSPYANIPNVVNLENTTVTSDVLAWETVNIGENVII